MTNEQNAWLSDEEMEEFGAWADDLVDTVLDDQPASSNPSQTDSASSTPLPEYVDPGLAEELAGKMIPAWFGTRWRDIPIEDQPDAWNGLRQWVDWLTTEYRLPTAVVPACWYRHTDIVAELYAAMCMEYKVWEEGDPGLNPMMFWHTNLQQMIHRLREMVTNAGCVSSGAHKEPMQVEGQPQYELQYDDADWLDHVYTVTKRAQFDRPTTGIKYVRANVVDDQGEFVAQSVPIGLRHRQEDNRPMLHVDYLSTNNDYHVVEVAWMDYRHGHQLYWETSNDGQFWQLLDE